MLFYKATFYCFLNKDLKDEEPGKTTSAKYRSQLLSYLEYSFFWQRPILITKSYMTYNQILYLIP